jgi:hypothetical protein
MKPILQLYVLCLKDLADYKEGVDYWDKIEETLKDKEMYKDDKRRKNRMDNLKLMKVQELLFDEFINKLKEPKIKKVIQKKITKKSNVKVIDNQKEEISINTDLLEGELKVIESKVKNNISYKIKICDKDNKVIYKDEGENEIKDITKEKMIRKILSEIYEKYSNRVIKIKLNNKQFIKDYKILIAKYDDIVKTSGDIRNNKDASKNKIINEIINKNDLIKIKDNIVLIE